MQAIIKTLITEEGDAIIRTSAVLFEILNAIDILSIA